MSRYKPEVWSVENSRSTELALAAVLLVVGLIFVVLTSKAGRWTWETTIPAAILGWMLLAGAAGIFFWGGKQTITVDEARRYIKIELKSFIREKQEILKFKDIVDVEVIEIYNDDNDSGFFGMSRASDRDSNYTYFVQVLMKNGKKHKLYSGAYKDRHDHGVMDLRRHRIWEAIQATHNP